MSFQEPKNALVERRELLLLAAVVGIPLLLRLLVAITPTCISSDGVSYVDIAKQIARGGDWFHPIFPPGYSLLIAAVHTLLGGSFEQIGRYISSAAGALVIIPAWFVWRSAYGAVAAGFSCLLFTMSPLSVELGGMSTPVPPVYLAYSPACMPSCGQGPANTDYGDLALVCFGVRSVG